MSEQDQLNDAIVRFVRPGWSTPENLQALEAASSAVLTEQVRTLYDAVQLCAQEMSAASRSAAQEALSALLATEAPWLRDDARSQLTQCFWTAWW